MNCISLFCLLTISLFALFYAFSHQFKLLLSCLPASLIFITVLFFNKYQWFTASRIIVLAFGNIGIFYATFILSYNSNAALGYLCSVALTFLIFSNNEKKYLFFFTVFSTFLLLLSQYLKRSFLSEHQLQDDEYLVALSYFFCIVNIACIAVCNYTLSAMVEELQLKVLNDERDSIERSKKESLAIMSAGIAHEINNPLAIIISRSNQIISRLSQGSGNDNRTIQGLENIIKHSKRIGTIIKSLRSFSRNSVDDPTIQYSIKEIVEESLVLCSEKITKNNIVIKRSGLDSTTHILCRPGQIMQVIVNLLNNSCDAISNLLDKWIEILVFVHEDIVKIIIKDSGDGIDSALKDKIMQPFFTTKEVGKGTGLGLSLSQTIIESHGGMIYLDSSSNNTCFIIELPRSN